MKTIYIEDIRDSILISWVHFTISLELRRQYHLQKSSYYLTDYNAEITLRHRDKFPDYGTIN